MGLEPVKSAAAIGVIGNLRRCPAPNTGKVQIHAHSARGERLSMALEN